MNCRNAFQINQRLEHCLTNGVMFTAPYETRTYDGWQDSPVFSIQ